MDMSLRSGVRNTAEPLLRVHGIGVRFGGVRALDSVSFDVQKQTVCGVIGPNGAGKTTLFNCLSRLYQPTEGAISFNGEDLLSKPVHGIAGMGIGRTFQNLALFPSMTVLENVLVGVHSRTHAGFLRAAFKTPAMRREEREALEDCRHLLSSYGLAEVADRPVGELPFGTRKRVELARAMASHAKLLLLDEPAAGLNHEEVDRLEHTILDIRRAGIAVLLVEHHMNLVMRCSDHVVALDFGKKIADGTPDEVQRNDAVIAAYLGSTKS